MVGLLCSLPFINRARTPKVLKLHRLIEVAGGHVVLGLRVSPNVPAYACDAEGGSELATPRSMLHTWGFSKIRGTIFWGPYNKDPTIWGTILASPIFI